MGVVAANLSLMDAGVPLATSVSASTCGAFLCRAPPEPPTAEVVADVATEELPVAPATKPWLTPPAEREVQPSAPPSAQTPSPTAVDAPPPPATAAADVVQVQ